MAHVKRDWSTLSFVLFILCLAELLEVPCCLAPLCESVGFTLVPSTENAIGGAVRMTAAAEYSHLLSGTVVANPGSFSNGSFGFHVYLPFDRKIEDSAVDLEAAER